MKLFENNLELKSNILAILLALIALIMITSIGYWIGQDSVSCREQTEHIILEGNSFKGVSAVYYPSVYVLGTIHKNTLVDKIIQCESDWDNSARGKAGEIGLAQFKIQTWNYFNKLRGTDLDIYNAEQQVEMLEWGLRNGMENHWSCFKKVN